MFWVSKVFAPLALAVGIATATAAFGSADGNQPPGGNRGGFGQPGKGGKDDRKKTDDKKSEDKKGQPGDKKGPPPKPDAVVDAWVKVLVEKITDPHDTVRDSARGTLISVGPPALPALQKLADGDDPAKAVAARKVIHAIHGHHGHDGHGHDGHGMGGPGMGMGPMGGRGMGPGMGGRGFGPGGFGGRWMGPGGRGGPGGDRGRAGPAATRRARSRLPRCRTPSRLANAKLDLAFVGWCRVFEAHGFLLT